MVPVFLFPIVLCYRFWRRAQLRGLPRSPSPGPLALLCSIELLPFLSAFAFFLGAEYLLLLLFFWSISNAMSRGQTARAGLCW